MGTYRGECRTEPALTFKLTSQYGKLQSKAFTIWT